ncbi:hypothetical protein VaNZ11_003328 [Volvox africanus]|uniref:Protein kinase domain-containing protein n=1 Tax=Volvox africanus TaxID=51714 RepID=A0ABQ5RTX8_9CHLO|nr:hypothetical protein VaNZ11_003328 [Volvox africanus]
MPTESTLPQGNEAADRLCHATCQPSTSQGRSLEEQNGLLKPSRGRDGVRNPKAGSTPVAAASPSMRTPGLNAYPIQDLRPENVAFCDAHKIMDGLCLQQRELGRGSYGIVVPGIYQGAKCAVKIMLSTGLDGAAVRELLLSPRLVHPNTVSTYASRCAQLTHEFFDLLEGERSVGYDPNFPRVLEPVPLKSEDGFGEPRGINDGSDPLLVLHQVLYSLGADTGKMVVVIIQEYCDRGTLESAIRKKVFRATPQWGVRLARRALLRSAVEIARGLLHLHDWGVVHGDVKPANVLLGSSKEDRRGFVAKVGDFGLAHVLPSDASSLYTDTSGSLAYMAPETFRGKVSRATDVWSFGVCLWQMLTGERPYDGYHYSELMFGVQEGILELQWPVDDPMTAPLIELGRQCLSHRPENRPPFDVIIQRLVNIEREIRAELLSSQQQQQQHGGQQEQQEQQQESYQQQQQQQLQQQQLQQQLQQQEQQQPTNSRASRAAGGLSAPVVDLPTAAEGHFITDLVII